MQAKVYGIPGSHPVKAAMLMLEHKGIAANRTDLPNVVCRPVLRAMGFPGPTVPAVKVDGRKVQTTRGLARALDEIRPDPPLFPPDPDLRRAVEDAEAWGDEVLQPVPRRLLRWAVRHSHQARIEFARMVGNPAPRLAAIPILPVAAFYARFEDAGTTERIRQDWAEVPGHLDHVDALIAEGTLHGDALNAADFQISTTLRVMLAFEDFAPLISGRPAEALARRVWPEHRFAVPALLPAHLR